MQGGHGQHGGGLGDIHLAGGDLVEGGDDVGGQRGHVDPDPRGRTVRLAALELDFVAVRSGHHRARTPDQGADRARERVQTEDRIDLGILQHAFLDHQRGAALLAHRRAFLGGLEDEDDRALDLVLHAGEDFRRAHQDGDVAVVAAGVHHRHGLAVVLRRNLRGERQAGLFGDRQSVHVGAQGHDLAGLAALQDTDDPGLADSGAHFHAQAAQMVGDHLGGANLAVAEFGMLMQIAAPGDDLGLQRLGLGENRGVIGLGGRNLGLRVLRLGRTDHHHRRGHTREPNRLGHTCS